MNRSSHAGRPATALRLIVTVALAGAMGACAHRREAPHAGMSRGTPPDLRGHRVMVLPVQENLGVRGDLDAELAFALKERGAGVQWTFPEAVDRALSRSPGLDAKMRGLPVAVFEEVEVRRVGDPLYGELRRLAALVDAQVALVPVRAGLETDAAGATLIRLSVALLDVQTGRVLWFGVAGGDPGAADDPRALASAVDRLARTLLWYVAG